MLWRHGHHFKLRHVCRAMAGAGAYAVRACVATADHHHVFAVSAQLVFEFVARIHLVLLWQKFHREVDTRQVAARRWQIA